MSRHFWLYAVSCTPITNNDSQYKMLLFCLDAESNTHVIQVQDYETSISIEPDLNDMHQLAGQVGHLQKTLPWNIQHLVSHIETWNAIKLIGFTNSEQIPVLQLFLRNEQDRKKVQNCLKFQNHMCISSINIKQFLHSRRDPETQFLFDSGLKLNTWFEAHVETDYNSVHPFDQCVQEHIGVMRNLRLLETQPTAPVLRKMYIRIVAHSSTATQTNQFDPSSDIVEDEVRQIGYCLANTEPQILDIVNFENSEKQLLENFGHIIEKSNIHVFVFASDERCTPNCLVYLFRRAQRYQVNMHFSKLHALDIECEMKTCGKNSDSTYLVFKHFGSGRANICDILQKAQVNPNLDGFSTIDALRHPKLVRKKEPFAKMLHLNYHGLNSFSTQQEIHIDLNMQVALLKSIEIDSDFVNAQGQISRICDLDLTSVCERGQQARVANLWARAYHNSIPRIVINDEQVKTPYVVVHKADKDSSYPSPEWIENPPVSAMVGDKPFQHILKEPWPERLQGLLQFPHNNIFNIPETKKDNEQEPNEIAVLASNGSWWANKKSVDFVHKSKKRKKTPTESKKRFRGGICMTPLQGFYTLPEEAVATFDFGSLYPSIIEGFVLCYMRVIYDKKWLTDPNLEVEYIPITLTECLVLAKNYRGADGIWRPVQTITPQIVHDIVELRKSIRREQAKEEEGSFKWNTLERGQLAAKVVQNSVYGYIGSETSGMTCTALAASVTALGQYANKCVRACIMFRGNQTVYGDTDSCMARFFIPRHLKTRDEIFAHVYEEAFFIQKFCTSLMPPPNKLEFECVKSPFLLTNKKKTYAAIQWSSKPQGWKMAPDPKAAIKGMAAKKRDKCGYAHDIAGELIKKLLRNNEEDSIDAYVVWYKKELDKIPKGIIRTIEELNPFIVTCSLNSEYKNGENVLAPSLAKMIAAHTGAYPRVGQRLPYVSAFYRDDRLHAKACIIPDVFLQRKDRIDIEYYLEKQIWNCVKQILCLPVHKTLRDTLDLITKRYIHEWKNKTDGRREVTDFFEPIPNAKRSKPNGATDA